MFSKLVAGEAQNDQTEWFKLFLQCIQFNILARQASVAGHVDEEDVFASIPLKGDVLLPIDGEGPVLIDGAAHTSMAVHLRLLLSLARGNEAGQEQGEKAGCPEEPGHDGLGTRLGSPQTLSDPGQLLQYISLYITWTL